MLGVAELQVLAEQCGREEGCCRDGRRLVPALRGWWLWRAPCDATDPQRCSAVTRATMTALSKRQASAARRICPAGALIVASFSLASHHALQVCCSALQASLGLEQRRRARGICWTCLRACCCEQPATTRQVRCFVAPKSADATAREPQHANPRLCVADRCPQRCPIVRGDVSDRMSRLGSNLLPTL